MTSWTRSYLTNQRSQALEIFEEPYKRIKSSYSKNQISSFKNGGTGHKTYLRGWHPPPPTHVRARVKKFLTTMCKIDSQRASESLIMTGAFCYFYGGRLIEALQSREKKTNILRDVVRCFKKLLPRLPDLHCKMLSCGATYHFLLLHQKCYNNR